MVSNLETVKEQVEKLRKRLYDLASKHRLTDPVIVNVSQELDYWLNQYNELIRKNKQHSNILSPINLNGLLFPLSFYESMFSYKRIHAKSCCITDRIEHWFTCCKYQHEALT